MPARRLDHVQIAAPPACEPAARRFFGDLLDLEEVAKPIRLSARDEALHTDRRSYSPDPWGNRIEFLARA